MPKYYHTVRYAEFSFSDNQSTKIVPITLALYSMLSLSNYAPKLCWYNRCRPRSISVQKLTKVAMILLYNMYICLKENYI